MTKKNRNRRRKTNSTWFSKHILYFIFAGVVLVLFIAGLITGLSIANNIHAKEATTAISEPERIMSSIQITSDCVWNGEIRR